MPFIDKISFHLYKTCRSERINSPILDFIYHDTVYTCMDIINVIFYINIKRNLLGKCSKFSLYTFIHNPVNKLSN